MTDQTASIGRLCVSLPDNTVDMARAAIDAGADSVKVHLNLHHAGSGHTFGPFAEYRKDFEAILELGVPVGLVPGGSAALAEDLHAAEEMGFNFLNADLHAFTAPYLHSKIELVPAPGDMFARGSEALLELLPEYPGSWIEGFAIDAERIGRPLSWQDLLAIRRIGRMAQRQVLVPSVNALVPSDVVHLAQRQVLVPSVNALVPSDVVHLFNTPEVGALLLGVIVVGTTTDSVGRAVGSFREAIDALNLP